MECSGTWDSSIPDSGNHFNHLPAGRRRLAVLAIMLDLFNREVVGWSLKPRITADSVTDGDHGLVPPAAISGLAASR